MEENCPLDNNVLLPALYTKQRLKLTVIMMKKCDTLVSQMELLNNDIIIIVETLSTGNMKEDRIIKIYLETEE